MSAFFVGLGVFVALVGGAVSSGGMLIPKDRRTEKHRAAMGRYLFATIIGASLAAAAMIARSL